MTDKEAQELRLAVIEECAAVADSYEVITQRPDYEEGALGAAAFIADKIRKLRGNPALFTY